MLSLSIHVLALVFLIWGVPALAPEPIVYQAIEIRVVSAPPAPAPPPPEDETPPAPQEELVVETPEEPVEEEEAPIPVEEEAPPPEPEETPPPEVEDPPPPAEDPVPVEAEESVEEDGGQDINVRLEGLRRDYPAYYDNIIRQIERCFRPTDAANHVAVVRFMIREDGSVSDISIAERSGSFIFDLEAQGAIECAGTPGRLGPLPEGYSWDVLPVQFRFRPGSEDQQAVDNLRVAPRVARRRAGKARRRAHSRAIRPRINAEWCFGNPKSNVNMTVCSVFLTSRGREHRGPARMHRLPNAAETYSTACQTSTRLAEVTC